MKNSWKIKLTIGVVCLAASIIWIAAMCKIFFWGTVSIGIIAGLAGAGLLAVVAAGFLGFGAAEKLYRR